MPQLRRQAPGTTIISYAQPSSTSSASSQSTSAAVVTTSTGGTPSSSLYLFTFLITIVVLGLISGALLFRAYYMRRQFHRRVEEAIRNGRPIPTEAAAALGLPGMGGGPFGASRRGKKEKNVGPMPSLWEVKMYRDGEKWELGDDGEPQTDKAAWDDFTPLSVSHYAEAVPNPAPQPELPQPPTSPSTYLRSFLSTRPITPQRPALPRQTTAQTIPKAGPRYTIPSEGDEVVVGVMIAMPVEGAAEERWNLLDGENDDEREVPEVCLGVMSTRIGS